ncbi:MAG: zinc ribbon domain-containing protein [Bryobacteraceae bacterium]|jgi:ABC-type phosphate transport system permease subunit
MPDYCTCGTQLVDNASFCHRCGRPTSEAALAETVPPIPQRQPTLQEKLAQIPVSFSNPIALRVAFVMSLAIMLVEMIPVLNLLVFLWWLGAGWGAVLLYRRITGLSLTVSAGARLGSITGVLTFAGTAIVLTLTMVFAGKQFLDEMIQQDPQMKQVINDPALLGTVFLVMLALVFSLVVGICAAGGALGARFIARKTS